MNNQIYLPSMTLREAREVYFHRYGFDNGGYDAKWVRLKAGRFTVAAFPNIQARVLAVRYHDLHHILTGYEANWIGEAEIGAWEVASGCGRHYPAWILNLNAMVVGLAIAPIRTYRAFVRGRRSRNLYKTPFNDELLNSRVGEMRRRLGLDGPEELGGGTEKLAFALWSIAALAVWVAPFVALLAGGAGIWWLIR